MMGHLLLRTALATTFGVGLQFSVLPPAAAQGVPVVDTQNIAQNIQQLRQMIEDEILQNEQLTQLREQLVSTCNNGMVDVPEGIELDREQVCNCVADKVLAGKSVQELVANLMDNALKYGRTGGLVGLRCVMQDERVLIEVEDRCGGLHPVAADWWSWRRAEVAAMLHIGLPGAAENVAWQLAYVFSISVVASMGTQVLGMVSIFITSLWGMWQNMQLGAFG